MIKITVLDLVGSALRAGGYDGLYNPDGECACLVGDLEPCGEITGECRAGYKVEGKAAEQIYGECGLPWQDVGWAVVQKKPASDERK